MDGLVTAATDYPPVFSYVPAPTENQAASDSAVIGGVHHVGLVHQHPRSVQQHVMPGHMSIVGAPQIISRPSKFNS